MMLNLLYPYGLVCINSFIKQQSTHSVSGSVPDIEGTEEGRIFAFIMEWTEKDTEMDNKHINLFNFIRHQGIVHIPLHWMA